MTLPTERRREKRLRYNWPIWFAEDYNNTLSQGQMIDISSHGAAFTCYADNCPHSGEHITARFSVPRYDSEDSFDLESFVRGGNICRVEHISPFVRRVALQFAEPLPFKPGEIADNEGLLTKDTISLTGTEKESVSVSSKTFVQSEAEAMAESNRPIESPESAGAERAATS